MNITYHELAIDPSVLAIHNSIVNSHYNKKGKGKLKNGIVDNPWKYIIIHFINIDGYAPKKPASLIDLQLILLSIYKHAIKHFALVPYTNIDWLYAHSIINYMQHRRIPQPKDIEKTITIPDDGKSFSLMKEYYKTGNDFTLEFYDALHEDIRKHMSNMGFYKISEMTWEMIEAEIRSERQFTYGYVAVTPLHTLDHYKPYHPPMLLQDKLDETYKYFEMALRFLANITTMDKVDLMCGNASAQAGINAFNYVVKMSMRLKSYVNGLGREEFDILTERLHHMYADSMYYMAILFYSQRRYKEACLVMSIAESEFLVLYTDSRKIDSELILFFRDAILIYNNYPPFVCKILPLVAIAKEKGLIIDP